MADQGDESAEVLSRQTRPREGFKAMSRTLESLRKANTCGKISFSFVQINECVLFTFACSHIWPKTLRIKLDKLNKEASNHRARLKHP